MTDDLLARLAAPFPPSAVSWRVGATNADKTSGLALAYVDARDVQDRLNEVCGALWQTRHHDCGGGKLGCDIGIKIGEEWLWRGDGAGSTDVEGDKGAFSDSFKRAAVRWGVARYLYEVESGWGPIEKRGNSYILPERRLVQLRAMLSRPAPVTDHLTRQQPPAPQRLPQRPVEPSQPVPVAAAGLREVAQRIHHAFEIADSPERLDGIIRANQAALHEIETLGPKTYAALMAFAGERRSEILDTPRALRGEEQLMGQP